MPRSALIVAVPEAEPLVGEWRLRYDNASLGIPAHVTLLFPFMPAGELGEALFGELRELFAAQPAFSVAFPRVARFTEVAWLAPEPAEPFRRLTELTVRRYPSYLPYEGIHDEVIPHLTVAVGDGTLQDQVDAALTPHLPIGADVREVVLLEEQPGGHWRTRERFSLGRYDRLAGAMFLAAAIVVGFGRIVIGAHYPADVLAGVLVGLAAALLLAKLGRKFIELPSGGSSDSPIP